MDDAVVTLTVSPIPNNTHPIAVNASYAAISGLSLNVFLKNGLDGDDILAVVDHGRPDKGQLFSVSEDGSFTYVLNKRFIGVEVFSYVVSNGKGGTETATVYLNVGPAN